ncbi:MAG: hypothetical protein V3S01_05150, partial [Dehalococcoidia bacterium]
FSSLPAPVGGVITLQPDTYYVLCGAVDIGPNRIECPSSSVISGKDPLVDSLTADPAPNRDLVSFPQGGTIRDLSLLWPVRASAVIFGASSPEPPPPPPAENCVVWNVSILGAQNAVTFRGQIGFATVSRVTATQCDRTIWQQPGAFLGESAIIALYASMIASVQSPAGARQLLLQGVAENCAASSMFIRVIDPTSVGIKIENQVLVLQFWGCSFSGPGVPSEILDLTTGATETTGTATQSEAAAMVGYTNSTTRGEISVFQPGGGTATITPTGTYVPVGDGAPGHPLYTLGASSVRFALSGGPNTDTQTIEYIGLRPCVCTVAVSLTVALAAGFLVAPRTIGARLLRNGVVEPDTTWEGGFAPGAVTATAGTVAFSTGLTLQPGDTLQLELANLGPGPGFLVVTGAEISIS